MSEQADQGSKLLQDSSRAQSNSDVCVAHEGQRSGSPGYSAHMSAHFRRHAREPQYGTVGNMHTSSSSSSGGGGGGGSSRRELSSAAHSSSCKQQASEQHAEPPSSKRRCGLPSRAYSHALLAALLCCLLLSTPLQAARTVPPPPVDPQAPPHRVGYEYAGRVQFVKQQRSGMPVLHLDTAPAVEERSSIEHHTVLVTRSGHAYMKRLPTNVTEPELAEALASTAFQAERGQINDAQWAQPVQARRLMASAQPQIGVSNVSTDLDCDGCSTTDTRQQVTNTLTFPFSAIGELTGQLGTSNRGLECTGTLIGPKHVVTAAHCVFDINDSRQYVSSLNFSPGESSDSSLPFGTDQWSSVRVLSQFTSQPSYTPTAMNYDFALITLRSAASASAGYMGMTVGQGAVTMNLTTAGYPGEKPPGTMWESLCARVQINYGGNQEPFDQVDQCQSQACANIISHTCLSSNGQSGSSMWDTQNRIRAILTGKVSTSDGQDINVATKVDAFVYNTIAQWYNEDQKADGSNQTLPAAPSGQQPPPDNSSPQTFLGVRADWSNPAFVAIVVGLCAAGLLLLIGLGFLLSRVCCGGSSHPKTPYGSDVPSRRQQQRQYMTNGAGAYPNGAPGSGGYPSHYAGSQRAAQGVAYDERTGQFIVNGQPYGAYR